jgi:hypothetical protein
MTEIIKQTNKLTHNRYQQATSARLPLDSNMAPTSQSPRRLATDELLLVRNEMALARHKVTDDLNLR